MSTHLEDYALIGDCETAALVARSGSIDWLCWPRFDSGACFAALLGTAEHGRWLMQAVDGAATSRRRYRDGTLILETRIDARDGAVTVIDFMPPRGHNSDIVRLIRGERGVVSMRTELVLRFDYGRAVPWVSRLADGTLRAIAGPDMVTIRATVPLHGQDLKTVGDFKVAAGQTVSFVLTHGPSHLAPPEAIDPEASLARTETFWREWVASHQADGEWAGPVTRSLITLKALTYAPTGGIVAAPTTSLPEQLGGSRNWDYRFCWLRDATLTLLAFVNAGHHDEARDWRDWLLRAAAGAPSQLQIMYGLGGERRLDESAIGWLPGYEQSLPVRVGNAAHAQLQLDVFGEVMDVLYQARRHGLEPGKEDWAFQRALIEHLEQVWRESDNSIWEVRGAPRPFTYSKVMAWVAFDRGLKTIEKFGVDGPVEHWRAVRDAIHQDVCTHGFNRDLNSFVRSYGSEDLDASLLLLPTVGFLPASDPRIRGTVEAIEHRLFDDGFLRRYDASPATDGVAGHDGVFLACSFWLADAYVLLGRHDDARALFERLLALCNDVGLLSEQYDTSTKRLIGNFPQAYSHIALINTAGNLARARKPAAQRSAASRADSPRD